MDPSQRIKKYDASRSPCQRLPESEALPPGVKAELARLCGLYNPVQLQHHVNKAILASREAVAAQSSSSGREPAAQGYFFQNEASGLSATF
jgi:hypothetical protein